ncbi:MAG: hypothetical protein K8R58_03530 [Bacteroidales bacterium]|nr:hypothetical protein [Bacteroidales bacterium]
MILFRDLIKIILFFFIFFNGFNKNAISQNDKIVFQDYLIKTQKLNFLIENTLVESQICIRPDGTLEFIESIQKRDDFVFRKTIRKGDSIINLREKYVEISSDIIYLRSYFPPLLIHDSSVLNYSEYPYDSSTLFNLEMKYSTIFSNFNEPPINDFKADTVIRIILPINDTGFLTYRPVTYSVLTLTINNGEGILIYSEGNYDGSTDFKITSNKSCKIIEDKLNRTIKKIQKVDYKKEYYATVVGLDSFETYLIEIKLNDKCFVLERSLYYGIDKNIKRGQYPSRKQISELFLNLLDLKTKFLE